MLGLLVLRYPTLQERDGGKKKEVRPLSSSRVPIVILQ